MCQMFCGWRLHATKPRLVELGHGVLELDLVSAQCFFQESRIEELRVAEELQLWLNMELAANDVPIKDLTHTRLIATFSITRISWDERSSIKELFLRNGVPIAAGDMHRCRIDCTCEIAMNDAKYFHSHAEVLEWPVGWPD